MNKIGILLRELHDTETDLAAEYRAVAEREAANHDVYHLCHQFAQRCDAHAEQVRAIAEQFGEELDEGAESELVRYVLSGIRHKASELLGQRPEAGLLLLRDLRQLYLLAEEASVHWVMLGQVAQAVRDHQLLDDVARLHRETLTQSKWLTKRIKEAAPLVLTVAV